jgi:predicted exporter
MKAESITRKLKVEVLFNQQEFDELHRLLQKTTEKKVSTYMRKVALQIPVVATYRNTSVDDFLRDMLELKRELTALRALYNEAVEKLQLLEGIPEFRTWIIIYEQSRKALLTKVEQIHERLTRLYELWLQE